LHAVAQAACNRALALDPERDRILGPLSGRRLGVRVVGAGVLDACVAFNHDGVTVSPGLADADATVSGPPGALLSLLTGGDALPVTQGVQVQGDMRMLEAVRDAMARLRPDWHEPLSRLLGDELGHPVARGIEHALALAKRSARELQADTAEFLREESGLLAGSAELHEFGDQVDALRDAVERLEKRVSLIRSES
jgi:ubiquinone biosynthesis protein UbiJ